MRGKIPPLSHDGGTSLALLRWTSSFERPARPHFLLREPPSGLASDSPGNTVASARCFGSPATPLRSGNTYSLSFSCGALHSRAACPPDKQSNPVHGRKQTRSAEAVLGQAGHASSLPPCSPENLFPVWPSLQSSLAWCSPCQRPSVAAFSSAWLPGDPPLEATAYSR